MSTSALIGFWPIAFSRRAIHSGEAPLVTPLTERAKKAGQPSISSVRTSGPGPTPAISGTMMALSVPRPAAARSRAMPRTPMQS